MKKITFDELDLDVVASSLHLHGTVWRDRVSEEIYIIPLWFDTSDPGFSKDMTCLEMNDVQTLLFVNRALLLEGRRYEGEKGKSVKTVLARMRKQVEPTIMWKVFRRDGFKCVYCGIQEGPLTFDHFIPEANGGSVTVENGRTACKPCNGMKGDMEAADWLRSQKLKHRKEWVAKRNQRRDKENAATTI